MPSLGPLEILVVAVVALIVFGPEKLPELARTVGRAASQMRRMASEFRDEFETSLDVHDDDEDNDVERAGRRTIRHEASRPEPTQSRPGRAPDTGTPTGEPEPPQPSGAGSDDSKR